MTNKLPQVICNVCSKQLRVTEQATALPPDTGQSVYVEPHHCLPVIVYGDLGTGKTVNSKKLMQHFKCTTLLDGWTPQEELHDFTLHLFTTSQTDYYMSGAECIHISQALKAIA